MNETDILELMAAKSCYLVWDKMKEMWRLRGTGNKNLKLKVPADVGRSLSIGPWVRHVSTGSRYIKYQHLTGLTQKATDYLQKVSEAWMKFQTMVINEP